MGAVGEPGVAARPVVERALRDEADWWRVRDLLVETFATTPCGWNWDIRHWDGQRFHSEVPATVAEMAREVRLWESERGGLLGVVHREGPGEAVLELRPDARELEPSMLAWAEANLAVPGPDGRRRIELLVQDDDLVRRELLETSGYSMPGPGGWCRSMRLTPPAGVVLPGEAAPPAGYEIRTTRRDDADAGRMAELLNATFGRTIHSQREYLTFMDRSPSFDDHLNLVVVAGDGRFGAHVGITLDSVNQHAIVEPVATHPAHRRLGLARLLILEGLARARAAGASTADVETGDGPAANALYEAVGFGDATRFHIWRKDVEPA